VFQLNIFTITCNNNKKTKKQKKKCRKNESK